MKTVYESFSMVLNHLVINSIEHLFIQKNNPEAEIIISASELKKQSGFNRSARYRIVDKSRYPGKSACPFCHKPSSVSLQNTLIINNPDWTGSFPVAHEEFLIFFQWRLIKT